jgi:hypothetical protein
MTLRPCVTEIRDFSHEGTNFHFVVGGKSKNEHFKIRVVLKLGIFGFILFESVIILKFLQ